MMRKIVTAAVLVGLLTATASSQPEATKPGPEHKVLKKLVGTWASTMKAGGQEFKGTTIYKMELGGLWLTSTLTSDFPGGKFYGRSMESYDAKKKKYVSVWFDSMGATPMLMEGDYDKDSKTMTMAGEGPDMEGKTAKWKSVTKMTDNDNMTMSMYVGGAKEPMFTMEYKRQPKAKGKAKVKVKEKDKE